MRATPDLNSCSAFCVSSKSFFLTSGSTVVSAAVRRSYDVTPLSPHRKSWRLAAQNALPRGRAVHRRLHPALAFGGASGLIYGPGPAVLQLLPLLLDVALCAYRLGPEVVQKVIRGHVVMVHDHKVRHVGRAGQVSSSR